MALNALTAFARGQSAQVQAGPAPSGNHDGANLRATAAAPGSWTLALDSPGGREAIGGRQSACVARNWRRKSLERLDSRPENGAPAWAMHGLGAHCLRRRRGCSLAAGR